MTSSSTETRSRSGCVVNLILFRVVPGILLIALAWLGWRTVDLLSQQSSQEALSSERASAYEATATALNIPQDVRTDNDGVRLVQFATNTPDASQATEPTPVAPTPLPTSAPQSSAPEVAPTAIPLPDFVRPAAASVSEIAGTAVPTQVPLIPRDYELVNILLLGGDDELVTDGTSRTDTMIIVSINTESRSVSLLSLPRDLFVYTPTPTMTRLNTVYWIGEQMGWQPDGGFGLMAQTIFYNFGIRVHYYARVDFAGFTEIIDTLGGVDIPVDCAYEDYPLIGAELPEAAYLADEEEGLWVLPVGYYTFSGTEALWYIRTRKLTDDFDRGRRQQQLLRAVLRKALDANLIANFPTLWDQAMQVAETNIPFGVAAGLLPIALELDPTRIETFTLIRTFHTTPWQPPTGQYAGQFVQLPNYEPIRDLLLDFYQPPTATRLALAGASIAVYNGTSNPNWDRVAAEHLREQGYNAYAAGPADRTDYSRTVLVDLIATDKDSLTGSIAAELNIPANNVTVRPDPNRAADYVVTVGEDYSSCPSNVLPIESQ